MTSGQAGHAERATPTPPLAPTFAKSRDSQPLARGQHRRSEWPTGRLNSWRRSWRAARPACTVECNVPLHTWERCFRALENAWPAAVSVMKRTRSTIQDNDLANPTLSRSYVAATGWMRWLVYTPGRGRSGRQGFISLRPRSEISTSTRLLSAHAARVLAETQKPKRPRMVHHFQETQCLRSVLSQLDDRQHQPRPVLSLPAAGPVTWS